MKYTKEQMVQTFGDGFYDEFKKAMEIQKKTEEWDGLLEHDTDTILALSEDAESEFEYNMRGG